jgi:citrate lyase beta subunit
MSVSLKSESTRDLLLELRGANRAFMAATPGESGARQPVHTLYWPADDFHVDTVQRMGAAGLQFLTDYFPNAVTLGGHLALSRLAGAVYDRVIHKLQREPVEDLRVDFEDGYGVRSDAEEDAHVIAAAEAVAEASAAGTLSPFIGIRVKPFNEDCVVRSVRTIDLFVTTLVKKLGALPPGFTVTLPKVQVAEQVATLVRLLEMLEAALGLTPKALHLEFMIETTQAVIDRHGIVPIPGFIRAAAGRCVGVHFGTYDYTASFGVTAAHQSMTHKACDFAKQVIKVSVAGTGVPVSDGATNVLPVPRHIGAPETLTAEQVRDNRRVVETASRLHYDNVRYSLQNAFYQGWDMHPAQLPTRFAAVYAFYLEGLDSATARLRAFVSRATHASMSGEVMDDAATGQALLNYFLRGVSSGAITEDEALATGLTAEEFRTRSFARILADRKTKA